MNTLLSLFRLPSAVRRLPSIVHRLSSPARRPPPAVRRAALYLLLTLMAAGVGLAGLAAQARQATPAEADRLYREQSYAAALQRYEQLQKAGTIPAARRDEVQYRVAVCLGKTKQWDRALAQGIDLVKGHRGSVWEPRGLYWLGRLYLAVPHQGWRVGKRLYRGSDVPKTEAADKPEQVYLQEQDAQSARDALEAARVYYPTYRAAHHTEGEEIQLDFDLARLLFDERFARWAMELGGRGSRRAAAPADPQWVVEGVETYSPAWPAPKKAVYLYEQIRVLAQPPARRHSAALALLGKALWLQEYHAAMQQYAVNWVDGKPVRIPYPYQELKPEALLRQLVREFPDDPVRDQAQFALGSLLEGEDRPAAALAEFERLIAERPASKWVADARAQIEEITRRQLSINASAPQPAGRPARLSYTTVNVKRLHLEAYRVRLEEVVTRPERLSDPNTTFTGFANNFGALKEAHRHYGPRVAAWDVTTPDKGDFRTVAATIATPLKETGAYVVEATAPGVAAATLALVTDLALVQKVHRDGALLFAANAKTGLPVRDAQVVVKQVWYENNAQHAAASRGRTGPDGTLNLPLLRAPGRFNFQVETLAFKGSRYAATSRGWSADLTDNPELVKVYASTDRAVYRPGQTVRYRELVMRRERGDLKPLAGRHVKVEVRDPNGQAIFEREETASEFGSVHGEFALAAEAPLGEYTVLVTAPGLENQPRDFGGNRFRVEEYKKPEFEVSVTPEASRVRLGQPASARISARYYFGGPVPGAKVTYRVYRTYYAQSYRFSRPFDFLYAYAANGDYDTNYRNGEVVSQGEAHTDAQGEAKISFPTKAEGSRWQNSDLSYTIEADVQDASRRVISGSGAVKATRHDVAVFLDYPHGYATQGDRLDVEVVTLNPSDQPVSAAGAAKVFRQPETPDAKETLVHEEPLKTDGRGRALFRWTAERAGYFRIAFETRDTAGEAVSGSVMVWVDGPELAQGRFLSRGVVLAVKEPYYEEGQTARVLLVTPATDCAVLLTREANNQILDRQLLRLPGRSLEVKVPLARRDSPNVYLSALLVRDGQLLQATQELFVPPARQFAQVTVQADRQQYRPGEEATFHLQARDWQGRPLRTELSLAVTDASLAYIQKDYRPDVRLFLYGDRRSMSVQETGSPGTAFESYGEDHQPRGQYRTHEWLLPEGMGRLPDWPGTEAGYSRAALGDLFFGRDRAGEGRMMGGMGGVMHGRMANSMSRLDAPAAAPGGPGGSGGPVGGRGPVGSLSAAKAPVEEKGAPIDGEAGGEGAVRTQFADTAFWTPAVVTDAGGSATLRFSWPDNLTRWHAAALAASTTAQVGSGETEVTTKKDLLVRLQAPRFFVERDQVLVTANLHNALDHPVRAKVQLDLGEDTVEVVPPGANGAMERWSNGVVPVRTGSTPTLQHSNTPLPARETAVQIPAAGEQRVDWLLRVRREGTARLKMSVRSSTDADAVELTFPVLVHGVERLVTQSGALRDLNRQQVTIALPAERKPGSSEVVVQLTPSLAATMLDALPYLADYPYGCIEQTMSRFLPSVVVAKTLKEAGYDLEALGKRARLLEERERQGGGSRPVEHSPYTYPQGRPGTLRVRALASDLRRAHNPVLNTAELHNMVHAGLARIRQFQHPDGGWGWWPGDSSDPSMTAYVAYGLLTCRDAGYPVEGNLLDRALNFLRARFLEDDNFHRMAYEARVLAMDPQQHAAIRALAAGRLYQNRERLAPYSKALLAMALRSLGEREKAAVLLRNVETTARVDADNGTASWEESPGGWWRWYNDRVETAAAVLEAQTAIQPDAPLAPMLVKWLVNNRRGSAWHSTRETALAVLALCSYAHAHKELDPEYTLTLDFAGKLRRQYTVTRENALFFDNQFVVPDELLATGSQTLTITRDGAGPLYWSASTRYFSLEEPIRSTGSEIFVTRRYFRLLPGTASGAPEETPLEVDRPNPFLTGRYDLLEAGAEWVAPGPTSGGPRYERVALNEGDPVTSGDLLEVELQLESKNDYDYLVFEDLKPAGCEPVELRSGLHEGLGLYSNMELRDEKVAFFLSSLPQGRRTLTYRLRAEIPGQFHVLPTNGYAMYAPDIRCLSDERSLTVRDTPPQP
jgi:uncharacterized protein YfaS (alpha-2-macroglobulin family)